MPLHVHILQERYPGAKLAQLGDAQEVVKAVCRGTASAGFLEGRVAAAALREIPPECTSVALRIQTMTDLTTQSGVASTFESTRAADELRREIGNIFRDGTMSLLMAKYSYYGLDDAWATYDLMEAAERTRWMAWSVSAITVALVLILWRTIAWRQHKRHLVALREGERRYREVFDNTSESIVLLDVTSDDRLRVARFNPAAEMAFGVSSAEIAGKFIEDAIGEGTASRVTSSCRRCLNEGTLITSEEELDLPAGRRYFHTNLVPVRGADGVIHRIVGVALDITERRKAEVALHASEARLRTVVSNVPIVLFAVDSAGTVTLLEGKGLDSFGLLPGRLVGRSIFDLSMEVPQILDDVRRALANETFYASFEVGGVALDAWYGPLCSPDGTVTGVIGVAVDITRRLHAEQQLRASEERWQLASRGSHDGLWDWNIQTDEVFYSDRSKEILGYEEHDVINHLEHWQSRVHPDDLRRVGEELQAHLDRKTDFYAADYRTQVKDGSYKWTLGRGQALWDEQNRPIRMVGSLTDVNDRKQAEAALHESEERFRRVFEEGPLGVGLVGKDDRFLKVNNAFCRMVGYSEAELRNMSLLDITHPDDRQTDTEMEVRFLSGEIPSYRNTRRYVKKSGEIIWITLTASFIADETGKPDYGLVMMEDVTTARHAQEEAFLRQKAESLGVLTSGIAHDFNNLLGIIVAQSELVLADVPADSPSAEDVRKIKTVAISGAEIVRELMTYSGDGKANLIESVDVSELVEQMLELLKVSISKHAVLKTELGRGLPAVRGSASQIRQIVMNLVINASEAIGEKDGVIRVTTTSGQGGMVLGANGGGRRLPEGDYLRLAVSDSGCGVSDALKSVIFDPFFTTKFAGRGLGLAVVQGIVRDHAGTINLISGPGEGTTFEVFLPCSGQPLSESRGAPDSALVEGISRLGGTVLLVEDEPLLRLAVSKMLSKKGFSVVAIGDGSAAMDVLSNQKEKIDLILLDMTLPGTSSREVIEKALEVGPDIKLILMSAYSSEVAAPFLNIPQVRSFIRKPFLSVDLVRSLRDALSP